jgi:hypothetical protein
LDEESGRAVGRDETPSQAARSSKKALASNDGLEEMERRWQLSSADSGVGIRSKGIPPPSAWLSASISSRCRRPTRGVMIPLKPDITSEAEILRSTCKIRRGLSQ